MWIALAVLMSKDWTPVRTYFATTIVLSLLNWTGLARVVRGKIISFREEDYAVAGRRIAVGSRDEREGMKPVADVLKKLDNMLVAVADSSDSVAMRDRVIEFPLVADWAIRIPK